MAGSRPHGNADLLVVSARPDLRWLEWLVLCVSTDRRGDDARDSPARAKIANLRPEGQTTAKSKEQSAKGKKRTADNETKGQDTMSKDQRGKSKVIGSLRPRRPHW